LQPALAGHEGGIESSRVDNCPQRTHLGETKQMIHSKAKYQWVGEAIVALLLVIPLVIFPIWAFRPNFEQLVGGTVIIWLPLLIAGWVRFSLRNDKKRWAEEDAKKLLEQQQKIAEIIKRNK
jgi:hypothetical protein